MKYSLSLVPAALGGIFSVLALTHSSLRFVVFGVVVGLIICGAMWFFKSLYVQQKKKGMVKPGAEAAVGIILVGVPIVALFAALLLGGTFQCLGHLLNMVAAGSVAGSLLPASKRV
jgi:hypothetical protein